jgi:hypothetical protein
VNDQQLIWEAYNSKVLFGTVTKIFMDMINVVRKRGLFNFHREDFAYYGALIASRLKYNLNNLKDYLKGKRKLRYTNEIIIIGFMHIISFAIAVGTYRTIDKFLKSEEVIQFVDAHREDAIKFVDEMKEAAQKMSGAAGEAKDSIKKFATSLAEEK